MTNATLEQISNIEPETAYCMLCGTEYDLQKRGEKIGKEELEKRKSKNRLYCCSDNCWGIETSIQESS